MKSTQKKTSPWLTLLLVLFASIGPPMSLFKVGPVMDMIINDFHITAAQGGLVSTLFAAVSIFLSIPIGIIVSKYGNYLLGLLSMAFVIGGSLIGAVSTGLTLMLVSRLIEGVGLALICTVGPAIITEVFPPGQQGKAMGIFMCYMSLGQAFISTVAPTIIGVFGSWRGVWYFTCGYSAVFLVLWFFGLRGLNHRPGSSASRTEEAAGNAAADAGAGVSTGASAGARAGARAGASTESSAGADTGNEGTSVRSVLFNRDILMLTVCITVFAVAIQGILAFYPTFFTQVKGIESGTATRLTGLHGYIGCLGAVVAGVIIDKTGLKKWFGAFVMAACGILFISVPVFPASMAIVIILLIGFTVNLCPPTVYAAVPNACRSPREIGIAMGIVNTGLNVGNFLSAIIFGAMLDHYGWNAAFGCAAVMAAIGCLSMVLLKRVK